MTVRNCINAAMALVLGVAYATPSHAALLASVSTTTPAAVDLTAEGDLDWAVWGLEDQGLTTDTAAGSRKDAGGGSPVGLIPDPLDVNGLAFGDPLFDCGDCVAFDTQIEYAWSDGTPIAAATGETAALLFRRQGVGAGYTLSLPATTQPRIANVYLSAFRATALIEAEMSDGSGVFSDMSVSHPAGFTDQLAVLTMTYSSTTPGATLDLTVSVAEDLGSFENVGLMAVTLSAIPEPGTATLVALSGVAALARRRVA